MKEHRDIEDYNDKVNREAIYEYLLENNIATKKEIDLVCMVSGFNEEVLNKILLIRTGFQDVGNHIRYTIGYTHSDLPA